MSEYNSPEAEERIEAAVRALRNGLNGGGLVIACYPIDNNNWGMRVAMDEDVPMQLLEQLSDMLILGAFEKKEEASREDSERGDPENA